MRRETGTILAVDSDPPLDLLDELLDHVDGVKLGLPLLLDRGPDHLAEIADLVPGDRGVVCDFKLADIPDINEASVEAAVEIGATHVICHGFVGADSVQAAARACDGNVFVVAEMSHPGGETFFQPVTEHLIALAQQTGAYGIIAPATRPERVGHLRGMAGDLKIATPGVGTQGGQAEAVRKAGADWIIVGRSILDAEDPLQAAQRFSLLSD